jgi:uncharacterized membrane protein
MSQQSALSLRTTAVVTVLVVLAFIGTMFLRMPIPATTGYFNLGDMFVILAGAWLGPWAGLIVGAVGPAAADAIGFPQFILATAVTKGLEGLVVGLICKSRPTQTIGLTIVAAIIGSLVMIAGYFVFEAIIYPALAEYVTFFNVTTIGAAIIELGPNTVQAVFGVIGGVSLWRAVSGGRSTRPESARADLD